MDYSAQECSRIRTCVPETCTSDLTPLPASANLGQIFSTEDLARTFDVEPNSIRSAFCRQGHYMGLRPIKLPNRRLAWNAEAVKHLLTTGEAK